MAKGVGEQYVGVSRVDSNLFTWCRESRVFVAEASDLGGHGADLQRLYPNAADIGLVLVSNASRREAAFFLKETKRDADNDVTYWVLAPTDEALRAHPRLHGVTIHLLND